MHGRRWRPYCGSARRGGSGYPPTFARRWPTRPPPPASKCVSIASTRSSPRTRNSLATGPATSDDAVLGVDYFGFPSPEFGDLRRRFDGVLWIEDRAQALDAGPAWGDVQLFSPRKLAPVADGGLLVSDQAPPRPAGPAQDDLWAPEDARRGDEAGERPQNWYPLFRRREDGLGVTARAATARTLAVLAATPIAPTAARPGAPTGARSPPFWPTMRCGRRASPSRRRWPSPSGSRTPRTPSAPWRGERIWAPRHWAELPSLAAEFPREHALARGLLSLPCDQRYGTAATWFAWPKRSAASRVLSRDRREKSQSRHGPRPGAHIAAHRAPLRTAKRWPGRWRIRA